MQITKEILTNEIQGLRQQMAQTQSQLDSIIGAIQAVEQLIALIDKPEEEVNDEGQISA